MRMVVANISSLNGYYEGPGRNVTTLPMGSPRSTVTPGRTSAAAGQIKQKVTLKGIHYVQEDWPAKIGMALSELSAALQEYGDARLTSARLG